MPQRSMPPAMPEGPGLRVPEPVSDLPLSGLTLLAVEDSRFASEALRLLCQRSGARLRRAETIAAARKHFSTYRPDVAIVDLGLPDGDGCDLIAELAGPMSYDGLLLAASADLEGEKRAMAAGAVGFLAKPLESLAGFQTAILAWLHGARQPNLRPWPGSVWPDRQSLKDDLARAAQLLAQAGRQDRPYIVAFIRGLARASHDRELEQSAKGLMQAGPEKTAKAATDRLARILAQRLTRPQSDLI